MVRLLGSIAPVRAAFRIAVIGSELSSPCSGAPPVLTDAWWLE